MIPTSLRLARAVIVALLVAACGGSTAADLTAPGTDPAPNPGSPPWPDRTDLGTFGGVASYANDINDAGLVVGTAETAAGARRAFRWTREKGLQALGALPGDVESAAFRIAANGAVLGASLSAAGVARPVTWAPDGAISELKIPLLPGTDQAAPADLDQSGLLAGVATVSGECTEACRRVRTWVWSAAEGLLDVDPAGRRTYPAELNDNGVLIGTRDGSSALARPYFWARASGLRELSDFPGPGASEMVVAGLGLNNVGQAVGWAQAQGAQVAGQQNGPWLWDEKVGFRMLPILSGDGFCCHYGSDVSDPGLVVGASSQDQPVFAIVAVAWPTPGRVVRLEATSAGSSVALAVNRDGIAVGWADQDGLSAGHNHAIVWNVPAIARQSAPVAAVTRAPQTRRASSPGLRGTDRCLALPKSREALVRCTLGLAAGP